MTRSKCRLAKELPSFVVGHSALVLGLWFATLAAQPAHGGLENYRSFVVEDKNANISGGIRITYLGVNGYQFEAGGHALLVDPYFSRVGFSQAAFNGAVASDQRAVAAGLAHLRPRADAVLVTHAHFDHLLDVPEIMRRTGATLVGGPTAVRIAEATGISPNECVTVRPGSVRRFGPWTVHVLTATHDRIFGSTPFEGTASGPVTKPVKASDWKLGEPLAFVVEANGKRIYVDSGGTPGHLPAPAVRNVDLAILGVALPDSRRRYAEIVRQLNPRYVLPSHQDDFFAPSDRGFSFGKLTDFPGIIGEHQRQRLPGRLVLLDYFHPWTLR